MEGGEDPIKGDVKIESSISPRIALQSWDGTLLGCVVSRVDIRCRFSGAVML